MRRGSHVSTWHYNNPTLFCWQVGDGEQQWLWQRRHICDGAPQNHSQTWHNNHPCLILFSGTPWWTTVTATKKPRSAWPCSEPLTDVAQCTVGSVWRTAWPSLPALENWWVSAEKQDWHSVARNGSLDSLAWEAVELFPNEVDKDGRRCRHYIITSSNSTTTSSAAITDNNESWLSMLSMPGLIRRMNIHICG